MTLGLDQGPLPTREEEPKQLPLTHKNLRGADYYQKERGEKC